MDPNTFPTKGNLILAKNSLKLRPHGLRADGQEAEYSDPRAHGPDR